MQPAIIAGHQRHLKGSVSIYTLVSVKLAQAWADALENFKRKPGKAS